MDKKEKMLLRMMAKNQFEIMNMFERLFTLLWETEDAALQLLNADDVDASPAQAEKIEPRITGVGMICGKEFEKKTNNQKCCSSACRAEKDRRYQLEYAAEKKQAKGKKKEQAEAKQIEDLTAPLTEHGEKLSVAECQRIDAEHGVSYGVGELMGLHKKK